MGRRSPRWSGSASAGLISVRVVGEASSSAMVGPTMEIECPGGAVIRLREDVSVEVLERVIRACRKNSLFVGSESGGHRAAILLSIIASAKHCRVEPWAWLSAVLSELPVRLASASATGPPDLSDLLPDAWLKTHPEHRWTIDDIRKVERERSRQQKAGKQRDRGR